ncbi:hypothetical protein [Sorangium sp. So ce1097]|uniref:hypothetical protein n=1 Tax=Sorangium sp. So ce1097 TaxID=3133330 RepID=UPI003F61907B
MSQLGPLSRSIIEAARDGDRSTAADRARVRAKLRRSLALGAAVTAGGAAKAGLAMVPAKAALPWAIAALLAPAAVVAALHATQGEPQAAPRASKAGAVVAERAAAAAQPLASGDRAPAEEPREPAPSIEPAEDKALDPPRAASSRRTTPDTAPRSAPGRGQGAPPEVPAEDPLVAETRRLREVHESLRRGDPERALSLLDAADAGGQELREERAAARVVALCNLGKAVEGRAAMLDFLRSSPGSPYSDRVRAACEGK